MSLTELELIKQVFKTMHADSVKKHNMRQLNFIHHPRLYNEADEMFLSTLNSPTQLMTPKKGTAKKVDANKESRLEKEFFATRSPMTMSAKTPLQKVLFQSSSKKQPQNTKIKSMPSSKDIIQHNQSELQFKQIADQVLLLQKKQIEAKKQKLKHLLQAHTEMKA